MSEFPPPLLGNYRLRLLEYWPLYNVHVDEYSISLNLSVYGPSIMWSLNSLLAENPCTYKLFTASLYVIQQCHKPLIGFFPKDGT